VRTQGGAEIPHNRQRLDASAVAILFFHLFRAHAYWDLIGASTAFVLLALVAAVAVLRLDPQGLPVYCPARIGGRLCSAVSALHGENRPISLFGYLFLLNAGLSWVATRKQWPLLTTLTLILTTIYQGAWY